VNRRECWITNERLWELGGKKKEIKEKESEGEGKSEKEIKSKK
jgi:hypothetical protein